VANSWVTACPNPQQGTRERNSAALLQESHAANQLSSPGARIWPAGLSQGEPYRHKLFLALGVMPLAQAGSDMAAATFPAASSA